MKFDAGDRADGTQVEDRRGMGRTIGAGVGGLGLVGTLIYVALQLLGGSASDGSAPATTRVTSGAGDPKIVSESCQGITSAKDQGEFVACVQTNVQNFWTQALTKEATQYHPAKLVLFTDATHSGCGTASAQTGPFYCPEDHKVYLDTAFFDELHNRFHAKGGDFAEAYVVAHEYGHHVQSILGTERAFEAAIARDPAQHNALSVMLELQADCFAGVWGHDAYQRGKVSQAEIAQGLDAAASVGDDRIRQSAGLRVRPERFTHGSAADRQRWFQTGMSAGDAGACDTFSGRL